MNENKSNIIKVFFAFLKTKLCDSEKKGIYMFY